MLHVNFFLIAVKIENFPQRVPWDPQIEEWNFAIKLLHGLVCSGNLSFDVIDNLALDLPELLHQYLQLSM